MVNNKPLTSNLLNPKIWGSIFISALLFFTILSVVTFQHIDRVSDNLKTLQSHNLHFISTFTHSETQTKLARMKKILSSLKSISEEHHTTNHLTRLFKNKLEDFNDIENLIIFDVQGNPTFEASSLQESNISSREYVNFHKKAANHNLYISEPIIRPLPQNKVFTLTLPIIDDEERFQGVYLASIEPVFFDSINEEIEDSHLKLLVTSKRTGNVYYGQKPEHSTLTRVFTVPNTPFEYKLYTDQGESKRPPYMKQPMQKIKTLLLIGTSLIILFILFSLYLFRKQHVLSQNYKHLSNYDALTQVYNRRSFLKTLKREVLRAKRYENNLALIVVNIDYFKSINDQYGHTCGDQVLIQFSQLLSASIRITDTLFRIGDEEFAIVLPEAKIKNAIKAANNYRDLVEKHAFQTDAFVGVCTASFGVSALSAITFDDHDDLMELLIKYADKALYQAKVSRNTVKPDIIEL